MSDGKILGLYEIYYDGLTWNPFEYFILDRETFEKYKDNYFTYTINSNEDVAEFKVIDSKLITEDQDFIKKFMEMGISTFDLVEEIRFREEEDEGWEE
jgi:hypothetical protein